MLPVELVAPSLQKRRPGCSRKDLLVSGCVVRDTQVNCRCIRGDPLLLLHQESVKRWAPVLSGNCEVGG